MTCITRIIGLMTRHPAWPSPNPPPTPTTPVCVSLCRLGSHAPHRTELNSTPILRSFILSAKGTLESFPILFLDSIHHQAHHHRCRYPPPFILVVTQQHSIPFSFSPRHQSIVPVSFLNYSNALSSFSVALSSTETHY